MILKERICEAAPLLAELQEVAAARGKTVAQVAWPIFLFSTLIFMFFFGAWEHCGPGPVECVLCRMYLYVLMREDCGAGGHGLLYSSIFKGTVAYRYLLDTNLIPLLA